MKKLSFSRNHPFSLRHGIKTHPVYTFFFNFLINIIIIIILKKISVWCSYKNLIPLTKDSNSTNSKFPSDSILSREGLAEAKGLPRYDLNIMIICPRLKFK